MIRIITDSLCDLTMEYAKEINIDILPLNVCFGEVKKQIKNIHMGMRDWNVLLLLYLRSFFLRPVQVLDGPVLKRSFPVTVVRSLFRECLPWLQRLYPLWLKNGCIGIQKSLRIRFIPVH